MPAILKPEDEAKWLDPESLAEDLPQLLGSYPADEMVAHIVSSDVNSSKNDHPSLTDESSDQQLELG